MRLPIKTALKKLDKAHSFFNLDIRTYMTMREQIGDSASNFWKRTTEMSSIWPGKLAKQLYGAVVLTIVDLRQWSFVWTDKDTGKRVFPELDRLDSGSYELELDTHAGMKMSIPEEIEISDDQDEIVTLLQVQLALEAFDYLTGK